MKYPLVTLIAVLATVSFAPRATAQIRTPSQDFFEEGWERLEREIQILQEEGSESEENQQKPDQKPLLEVTPAPETDSGQMPNEVEPPSQKPQQERNNNR